VGGEFPHVAGVEHRFVEANGVRLHVAEAGEEGAEPLVMVHGWPQHWYEWRELIPPLAEGNRVICPDLRGFGWSEAPGSGYDPETSAADLLGLLDALDLDRVRLVGHDWGGWASFLLCLRHPERVSRLLALNIIHPWNRITARALTVGWRLWYAAGLAAFGLLPGRRDLAVRFINSMIRRSSARPECWDGGVLETFTDQLLEPERAQATSSLYRRLLGRELPSLWRGRYAGMRLTVPTLLLHGTGDFAIPPRVLDGYEEHADEMELELAPDTGHYIVDERPELVLERIRGFLLV
jgi:pimeloyl-ACP methyl ester carboxylesterase